MIVFVVFLLFELNGLGFGSTSSTREYARYTIQFERKTNLLSTGLIRVVLNLSRSTYIIDAPTNNDGDVRLLIENTYSNKVLSIEPVREYLDDLKPEDGKDTQPTAGVDDRLKLGSFFTTNLVCPPYHGLGIPEAWASNYTGKGVVVAVTDVGVNTDLIDLSDNIDTSLSHNFISNDRDITPEHHIQEIAQHLTDHGNRMASIIAAKKGNNFCTAGIAYDARIVGLKIFQVLETQSHMPYLYPSHWTRSDIIATALTYEIGKIDIFANAWASVQEFDMLDLATRAAFVYGAEFGRKGLGTIYLVPSGPAGNGLANNIYTITIGGVSAHGSIPERAYVDASVLTSALFQGNNLTSTSAVTTSFKNRCISTFEGYSLAVAQAAGITALALQANKDLSLRDIQHLMVRSSRYEGLRESFAFRSNDAGWKFHGIFGFGLLDAKKLVNEASTWKKVGKLLNTNMILVPSRKDHIFKFCHVCGAKEYECVTTVEQIEVAVSVQAYSHSVQNIRMEIVSPHGTQSDILDYTSSVNTVKFEANFTSVHFWDETAFGIWILKIQQKPKGEIKVKRITMTLYGTYQRDKIVVNNMGLCETQTVSKEMTGQPVNIIPSGNISNYLEDSDTKSYIVFLPAIMVLIVAVICVIMKIKQTRFNSYRIML